MLQNRFSQFIKKEKLLSPGNRVLLAVSGGVDSVVMAYLFHKQGINFSIAHCNFKLRNKESSIDEEFVRNLAKNFSTPFYYTSFNTKEEAKAFGDSVQMTARKLRYDWLETIRYDKGYDKIATAHHHDDNIETTIINLLRGTGIYGLTGIPLINDNIIRPLLFASKEEIEFFAKKHNIKYREDSSNKENKYTRNILRNKVIPVFEEINPDFRNSFKQFYQNIKLPQENFKEYIDNIKKKLLLKKNDRFFIPINELKKHNELHTILFELLKKYGFNIQTIGDIIDSLDKQPGKEFHSKEYSIVKDRENLIVYKITKNNQRNILIDNKTKTHNIGTITLKTKTFELQEKIKFPNDENHAFLDYDKLKFPLTLRPWEEGDFFIPLGMVGKKKISDFLIDKKISLDKKKNVYVLCSDNNVVWIVGHRIDNRFKIDNSSKKCFNLFLQDNLCQTNVCK